MWSTSPRAWAIFQALQSPTLAHHLSPGLLDGDIVELVQLYTLHAQDTQTPVYVILGTVPAPTEGLGGDVERLWLPCP